MDCQFADMSLCPPEDVRCVPSSQGIGGMIFEKLKQHGDEISQIDASTGQSYTYKDIFYKSVCIAQEMKARGITKRDIVSICAYNSLDSYLPLVASLFLGIKNSFLEPSFSEYDMIRLLAAVKPRIIFASAEAVEKIETSLYKTGLKTEIVVLGETEHNTPLSKFLKVRGSEDKFQPQVIDDISETVFVNFTSGIGGLPKAVCLSHYAFVYQTYLDIHLKCDTTLDCASSFRIPGIITFIKSIITGSKYMICSKFNTESVLQHIQDYKITSVFLETSVLQSLLRDQEYIFDLSSLSTLYLGGSPVSIDEINLIRNLLPYTIILNNYIITELCGNALMFNHTEDEDIMKRKGNSCGRPIPGVCYKVVNTETEETVGPHQIGELRLKSKLLMNGYHNRPDDTAKSYDQDGFLRTGDLFFYDEDHCFYFVERMHDMIKFQIRDVSPAVIEGVLMTHPDVREAVVVAKSSETEGRQPMAVVTLKAGSKITDKTLINYVNDAVEERNHLRGGIKVVNHIPKTPTGKFLRRELQFIV